jgi:hypothetical protein
MPSTRALHTALKSRVASSGSLKLATTSEMGALASIVCYLLARAPDEASEQRRT